MLAPAPIENKLNAHPMIEMSMVFRRGQPAAYAMVILKARTASQSRMTRPSVKKVESELAQLLKSVNRGTA